MPDDERALLQAWAAGDRRAGDAFIRSFFPLLWRYLGSKLNADVEDAIQATFLACLEHRHRLEHVRNVRSYVLAIARHELYARAKARGTLDVLRSSLVAQSTSPSTIAHRRQLERRLRAALSELPLPLQELLDLYFWEDLRGTALAEALGIPEGTMRSRLRRARSLLAARLGSSMPPLALDG